ncbi:MAG: tetratricopeptide repeat protein [Nitrospiraceae bacterium]|nr:tetratricopeptide repeat protein [Nitrospiraceae bacterium]
MKRTIRIVLLLLVMSIVWGAAAFAADSDYEAASKYYYSGKYGKAVELLRKYIEQNPDASAYYMLGYSLYELKRFSEADDFFRDAYLIDPNYSPIPTSKKRSQPTRRFRPHAKKHRGPAAVSANPQKKAAVSVLPAQPLKAVTAKEGTKPAANVKPSK